MKIAVMSDSHDNIWNLKKALDIIQKSETSMIIHCGDFVAPFMLKELNDPGIPVHGVFGNNDGDQYLLTTLSLTTLSNITLHSLVGQIEIGGIDIAFTHQPVVGEALASTGKYNLVCFGHSHEYQLNKIAAATILNPGEIMGKDGSPGFCFIDTNTLEIKRVELV